MRHQLKLHPDSRCDAVDKIEAQAERVGPAALLLTYTVTGQLEHMVVPELADPDRTDGLWQHTCLEAFVRPCPGSAYAELNAAPSRHWAAYLFDGYRSGMREAEIGAPKIEVRLEEGNLRLQAAIDFADLPGFSRTPWQVGLSAVIEEAGGRKSYWALAHPPGKADFHHSDGLVLQLPPAA